MNEETRLRRELVRVQAPVLRKSLSQLATSMGGFLAICAAMYAVFDM